MPCYTSGNLTICTSGSDQCVASRRPIDESLKYALVSECKRRKCTNKPGYSGLCESCEEWATEAERYFAYERISYGGRWIPIDYDE